MFKRYCVLSLVLFLGYLSSACTQVAYDVGLASCAPVYGNWCGENYPLTGNDPPPVDVWDEACRAHDMCYDSGRNKRSCDRQFQEELEDLSYDYLAPQAMANAHSWFKKDGQLVGFINLGSELRAATASCEGGDGREAVFYCQTYYGACELSSYDGPGQPGGPCNCSGAPGRIGEH